MITEFDEYQKEAISMRVSLERFKENNPDLPENVLKIMALTYDGLGLGEAGEVQGKIKKIIRDNGGIISEDNVNELVGEMGDTLWYLASMCDILGITLSEVADYNIEKLRSRIRRGTMHGSGDNR
jgi:NTP pyrophosphatase (non-canonical NTP hydrolase)